MRTLIHPRMLVRVAPLLVAGALFSGCVAIKSYSHTQRLQGYVTLRVEVCVSDHDHDTYATCQPGVNTAENDNGIDGDEELTGTHSDEIKRGQLLVGFRVPDGVVAPNTFQSTDLSVTMTKSTSYTSRLVSEFRPPAGFHWEGYISADLPFDAQFSNDRQTILAPEFKLPPGVDGAPFVGPFRYRAVVGIRKTGRDGVSPGASVTCDNEAIYICFDSPRSIPSSHRTAAVSDIGIHPADSVTVAPGDTTTVTFPIQNLRPAGAPLGNRTVALSASTNVPGTSATTAASSTVLVASPSTTPTQSTTVTVAIPPGTPVGAYTVTLTARAGTAPELIRTNTGTINVIDRTAPDIRISTPTEGATFTVGQSVLADYGCTEEAGGSGLSACTGPVPSGAAIDTSSPGAMTFEVSAGDAAGNVSTATRTYTVVTPAPVIQAAPALGRVNVTLSFGFPSARKSTKFNVLQINNIPSGSTLVATCKGKSCPTTKVKGKKRAVVFTKRNASGAVKLKPFLKKKLRAGTVITATVTKPGSFGMVKKLKVRAFKRPKLTTTCLQPGSTTAKAACSS